MKYLNKIVFINSADKSLKYAETELDGNVHFIGTQGVGKSTLLRAILFFYNADKQKLGIPREKKTFDDYYFPFQNSYIIYEVQTDAEPFCVLAFKTQGRIAFRFFDSAYESRFFIDGEGQAFESWDKTREAFGKYTGYTRIISSYEEYRNIIYGNNKGLPPEFRKYALLESKQFQNIPRTITNVFLNANLSAEFVKETIIKSLNEENIKIDLTTYSQTHLKDFEANLNDIKKWTERNRNGENNLEKGAAAISDFYAALQHLEKKKEQLAAQLGWALHRVKEEQPKVAEQLSAEEQKIKRAKDKRNELDSVFDKNKDKIQRQIGALANKQSEIKDKRDEYIVLNIEIILERVSSKNTLELKKRERQNEKDILTSKFIEISQRYEALLKQMENSLQEYENNRQSDKNKARENFVHVREELSKQYDLLYEEIRMQHTGELAVARSLAKVKEDDVTAYKIRRSEVKNKRFYEHETASCQSAIASLTVAISGAENAISGAKEITKNIEKEWLLEETKCREETRRKIEKQNEEKDKLNCKIVGIDNKIKNSKDSLYGWLNEEVPGWEQTIGKVIDEDNVLYKPGLHPTKISGDSDSFYGIRIDTNAIQKSVTTVAGLQQEKENFENGIKECLRSIAAINNELEEELDKLRKRFQPKIKEQREKLATSQYEMSQNKAIADEMRLSLADWKAKAITEQNAALDEIEACLHTLSDEKIKADERVQKTEGSIHKLIEVKKKEKDAKIKTEQQKLAETTADIDMAVATERKSVAERKTEIKDKQKIELHTKGADTTRITDIDLQLSGIDKELMFIETNTRIAERYHYDKEQLFDKEDDFKNHKNILEKQLETELQKHKQQQDKWSQAIALHNTEIERLNKTLSSIEAGLAAFDQFIKTDVYTSVEISVAGYDENDKTDAACIAIISEIHIADNTFTKRYIVLQEAIHKFAGNFSENNLFRFAITFIGRDDYFAFAEMLKEFMDENKISEYKTRVEERFAHIIRRIGTETGDLISKEAEISKVVTDINNDFVARNFVGAIRSMELKTTVSANRIFRLLVEIKTFNEENVYDIGKRDLFSSGDQANKNEKAVSLLKQLIKEMAASREKEITLSDSFELLFKIVENDNDTGWVEKLTNVGSEGTDVLVKAMINIMLLNVFKEKAAKQHKDDFRLHCMMDEIGKLHPNNVKGILKFANDRNILLINGSPTSYNAIDYKYTYLLTKDAKNVTNVKRLVKKITKTEPGTPAEA